MNYNIHSLYPKELNEKYLKELKQARDKYMVSDFPKYLKLSQEIINKYEKDFIK